MRQFVALVFLLTVVPSAAEQGRTILRAPLADGIQDLRLVDYRTSLGVVLLGESTPEFRGAVAKPVPATQVWLLRKDGTSVRQRNGLRHNLGVGMGGWHTKSSDISFEHVPVAEVAGVVVAVNDRLLGLAVQQPAVLLRSTQVSDDITEIAVSEQEAGVIVSVYGHSSTGGEKNPKPLLTATRLRVWLLHADGSAVRQVRPANKIGLCNAGSCPDTINFTFARTPRAELRGMVVELDGKMFVREIPAYRRSGVVGSRPAARRAGATRVIVVTAAAAARSLQWVTSLRAHAQGSRR